MARHRGVWQGARLLTLAAASAAPVLAQERPSSRIVPTNQVLITGYATAGYTYLTQAANANAFTASLNPVLLFQFQDRILFEAGLEFELEEGVTETGLEYAQLSYLASENLVISGGKFLLPFGVFGPRLHPTWINRFPTAPPIYGHHVAAFGAEPLLPVLSDVGLLAKATFELGTTNLSMNGYLSQGPSVEEHAEGAGAGDDVGELAFPGSSSDNNTSKMVGGRIDLTFAPWAELNVSAFTGTYDHDNVLDFTGYNVAGEFRQSGFEARGEYIRTRREVEPGEALVRHGFYLQGAYRYRDWEPVFRWTQVFDDKLDDQVSEEGAWQAGLGVNYWFAPSVALMAGYEINRERGTVVANDRIVVHASFGF